VRGERHVLARESQILLDRGQRAIPFGARRRAVGRVVDEQQVDEPRLDALELAELVQMRVPVSGLVHGRKTQVLARRECSVFRNRLQMSAKTGVQRPFLRRRLPSGCCKIRCLKRQKGRRRRRHLHKAL
jgi:hypothetical protein